MTRKAPPHIQAASAEYAAARQAWENGLAAFMRSATPQGKNYEGSGMCQEEHDYREQNPPPVFREYVREYCARTRSNIVTAASLTPGDTVALNGVVFTVAAVEDRRRFVSIYDTAGRFVGMFAHGHRFEYVGRGEGWAA